MAVIATSETNSLKYRIENGTNSDGTTKYKDVTVFSGLAKTAAFSTTEYTAWVAVVDLISTLLLNVPVAGVVVNTTSLTSD